MNKITIGDQIIHRRKRIIGEVMEILIDTKGIVALTFFKQEYDYLSFKDIRHLTKGEYWGYINQI